MNLNLIGTYDKDTYYKVVNYQTQCFNRNSDKEINNSIAYSVSKIKECIRLGKKYFKVLIRNHPNGEIIAIVSIDDFLKNSKEIYYKGKTNADRQRCLNLKYWQILPMEQEVLK